MVYNVNALHHRSAVSLGIFACWFILPSIFIWKNFMNLRTRHSTVLFAIALVAGLSAAFKAGPTEGSAAS